MIEHEIKNGVTTDAQASSTLNTHVVGLTGMRAVWSAVALHAIAKIVDAHLASESAVRIIADSIETFAVPALAAAGGYAAYRGRPRDVPDDERVVSPSVSP